MKIKIASDQVSVRGAGSYRVWIEQMMRQRWDSGVNWATQGEPVKAWVNHSNWVGSCPFCAGEIVVEPGEPYFCPDCAMQGNSFMACALVWPEDRAEIERLLLLRNDPNTRNWLTTETVDDLARENAEHGVGL
jgi:hypothetical protein